MIDFSTKAIFKGVDKLSGPLNKMGMKVNKFGAKFSALNKKMIAGAKKAGKGLAIGIGAGLATVTAGLFLLKRQIEAVTGPADILAKTARRIQFPIEEFQEFRFVAEQSGLATGEFDKGLETMTKRIGEAKMGTGALITILKKSNPQLLDQIKNTKDSAVAFDLMINSIREETDVTKKLALATTFFGKAGAKMVNITHNSAAEIKAMRLEMRENGILTKESAAAAEKYNDAMNSLAHSLTGLRIQILGPLLPALKEVLVSFREMINQKKPQILEKLKETVQFVKDNWEPIKKWGTYIGMAVVAFAALIAIILTVGTAIAAITLAIPGVIIALKVALVGAAIWAFTKIGEYLGLVGDLLSQRISNSILWLKGIWTEFVIFLTNDINELFNKLSELWESVKSFGGGILGAIGIDVNNSVEPQTVSPTERQASLIEQRITNSAEITIRDQSGRAEVTKNSGVPGLTLAPSGGF